jgi:hypothetical protein
LLRVRRGRRRQVRMRVGVVSFGRMRRCSVPGCGDFVQVSRLG